MAIRKRSEVLSLDQGDPEDIFGILDGDYSHPHAKKLKPRKPAKKLRKAKKESDRPQIRIPLERLDPAAFFLPDHVPRNEVVAHEVSTKTLRVLETGVNDMTRGFSSILLRSVVPAIIAVEKAQGYTSAVVSDVFGFETESDMVIPEILNDLARLEVGLYYVRKMRVSKAERAAISNKLIDVMVNLVPETIRRAEKTQAFSDRIRQLQGVYVKKPKPEHATETIGGHDEKPQPSRPATRRSRQ